MSGIDGLSLASRLGDPTVTLVIDEEQYDVIDKTLYVEIMSANIVNIKKTTQGSEFGL